MFYNEATKDYVDNLRGKLEVNNESRLEEQFEDTFVRGAICGYDKANEWHYPSKGEYPKECENVWCYCKGPGIKFCCVGHTIVGGDNKVRWCANNKMEELRIVAWKEIILPELPKESK